MLSRLRDHIRSNVVGYVVLMLAMGSSASALKGHNTVFSDDIVNGQVKRRDIGTDAVTTAKIGAGQVGIDDIVDDAVNGSKVPDGTLTGADIMDDSLTSSEIGGLTGADVLESTLGMVPSATVAGRGRSAQGISCDPESAAFVSCASVTFDLPGHGRVLMHGYGTGYTEVDSDTAQGSCALYTSVTGGFPDIIGVHADDNSGGEFGLSKVTPPMGPGTVTFEVHCNQVPEGAILYEKVGISVVQIGSS